MSGLLVAALVLAACGSSSSSATGKTTFKSLLSSIGSSPNLHVTVTATVTGSGTTKAQKILKGLSIGILASNPSGGPLSQAGKGVAEEFTVATGGTKFLDVRVVSSNVYFNLNAAALAKFPGVPISQSELQDVQLLFGGRWFELPESLLDTIIKSSHEPNAQVAADEAVEAKFVDALTKVLDASKHSSTQSGYSASGTVASVEQALEPVVMGLSKTSGSTTPTTGTYALKLTKSGSSLKAASLAVTVPSGTATVSLTISHPSAGVVAPSGATVITQQMLQSFGFK